MKKKMTIQQKERKRLWIIVSIMAFLLLAIPMAPMGLNFIAAFFYAQSSEPTSEELKSFQSQIVVQQGRKANEDIEKTKKTILSFPELRKMSVEEKASGDKCYLKAFGAMVVAGYNKTCYMRKTVVMASALSLDRVSSELKKNAVAAGYEWNTSLKNKTCIQGWLTSEKVENYYPSVYFQIGAETGCEDGMDPVSAHEAPLTVKTINNYIETYDEDAFKQAARSKGLDTYVMIAVDTPYFDEIIEDRR